MIPVVTLITDFGLKSHYVASMKAVIIRKAPTTRFVDISHEITKFSILEASFLLSECYSLFPLGTIHIAVVDPGVGSERRSILIKSDGYYFIGPDNGIFSFLNRENLTAIEIHQDFYRKAKISSTFHGRDIFASAAASAALKQIHDKVSDIDITFMGKKIHDPVFLKEFKCKIFEDDNKIEAHGKIMRIDEFGNLITNIPVNKLNKLLFQNQLGDSLFNTDNWKVVINKNSINTIYEYYTQAKNKKPFIIPGSSGYLEISVCKGNAQKTLKAKSGDKVNLIVRKG